MNDPNKVIDVNLSSLLSLKAELLRKQSEVSEAKSARSDASEYDTDKRSFASRPLSNESKKRNNVKTNGENKDVKWEETEDTSLLEKSRKVLEAKSKLYERIARGEEAESKAVNCLVDFTRKCHRFDSTVNENVNSYSDVSDVSSDNGEEDDDNEVWVEYTDCLGRTRKCLKEDLESAKKRDAELAASMPERIDQSKANWMIEKAENDDENDTIGPIPPESLCSDLNSMVSKIDEQKANWERVEQENLDKTDVHYQDVFFDEARQHGVGYYAFSTDEEERKKQQRELDEARERTMEEQQRRDGLRAQRERIIAERVLAAKNRQRARLGLAPLEKDDETPEAKKETKEERRARKKEEKLKRKLEKLEQERETERQQYIRPWDKEKSDLSINHNINEKGEDDENGGFSYKADHVAVSQNEWNERKRKERNADFAPPTREEFVRNPKRTNFTAKPYDNSAFQKPDYKQMPPPPSQGFSIFQSSKRKFQRKNCQNVPDCDESDDRSRTCIPPPEDLDYCTPAKNPRSETELERSIEAGLRFLRDSCDKGTFSTKSSWTAKADY